MKYAEAKQLARKVREAYRGPGRRRTRITPIGYLRKTKGFVGPKGWKVQVEEGGLNMFGRTNWVDVEWRHLQR